MIGPASTRAPSKVNVCLLLGPVRASDGRHELVTVFQALDLADDVAIGPAGGGEDVARCDPPLPDGTDDLALRAVRGFRAATGWDGPPVAVEVRKRIPVAGGMAGGSADAAAVLRLLARATGLLDGDRAALRAVAAELGADVPALVDPGRWLGTGAGEIVEPVASPPPGAFAAVLVTSDEGLATPDVFREADRLGLPRDAASLAAAADEVRRAAADLPAALCVNELEPAALSLRPDLHGTLDALRDEGADVALVSGSGPTCAGLFGAPERAAAAAAALSVRRPGRVHVAGPHAVEPAHARG